MSDEMIPVRSAIPGYAGFADVGARRLSDQQVRAYVGERLALVGERVPLGAVADDFEDAIIHCQFGDQHVIKSLENDAFAEPDRAAAVEAADGALLAAASGADAVTSESVARFVAGVRAALAQRNTAILGFVSKR